MPCGSLIPRLLQTDELSSLSLFFFFFFFFFERRITEPDAEILLLACFSRDRHSGIVCILIAIDPCVPE